MREEYFSERELGKKELKFEEIPVSVYNGMWEILRKLAVEGKKRT